MGESFGNGDQDYRDTNKIKGIVEALGTIGDARAAAVMRQILSADFKGLWPSGAHLVQSTASGALKQIEVRSAAGDRP